MSKKEEEKSYYEILGVKKDADQKAIKKAFRKKAMLYHPDQNPGMEDKFKEINNAYEVLKDANKRKLYNKYGKDLKPKQNSGDFFSSFFGNQSQQDPDLREKKGESIKRGLEVSLSDLYNGTSRKIRVTRTRICKGCKG